MLLVTLRQASFDLNSFWATAIASDLTITVTGWRSGQWLGAYAQDVLLYNYRVPITLPQPMFTVTALQR